MKRVFMYNRAITYIGALDKEDLALEINSVLNNLPNSIVRLTREEEIVMYSFDNNEIITVNINFYLVKNLMSKEEQLEKIQELAELLDTTIKTELNRQKLILTLD